MSAWSRQLGDLAYAVAALLAASAADRQVVQPAGTLAARDVVVAELRELVGSVSQAPRFAEVAPLTMLDVVQRPGQALHQSLSELPRAVPFGTAELCGSIDSALPAYEQHWRRAAAAAVGLESYVPIMGELPGEVAWKALRDLAELSGALRYLDFDLSEAILPALERGEDLALPYTALTSAGHDALRLAAQEIRARVGAPTPPPGGPWPDSASPQTGAAAVSRTAAHCARAVTARAEALSMPALRAMARMIRSSSRDAAAVLSRAQGHLPAAGEGARHLAATSVLATTVRDVPCRSTAPLRLDVVRDAGVIVEQMAALAAQARHLPSDAPAADLQRLTSTAVDFAQQLPMLTQSLEVAVRESLRVGVLLVPGNPTSWAQAPVDWATMAMTGSAELPQVLTAATELSSSTASAAPHLHVLQQHLDRQRAAAPDRARQQAVTAAVRHVGAARDQLRAALNGRLSEHPAALAAALPAHPGLAPARSVRR